MRKLIGWIVAEACFELLWSTADPHGVPFWIHRDGRHSLGLMRIDTCDECTDAREVFWSWYARDPRVLVEALRFAYALHDAGVAWVPM